MQPLGILILTSGVWLVYSGVVGIPPLETLSAIIAKPNQASAIIAKAKADTPVSTMTVGDMRSAVITRNPYSNFTVSADFAKHQGRNSGAPGIDFAVPVGTPIISTVAGVLSNNPSGGNGGYVVTVKTPSGYKHQWMHLSRFKTELDGKTVRPGQIIGYSGGAAGAVGAGNSTGPHIHYNIITPAGKFIDPAPWLAARKD